MSKRYFIAGTDTDVGKTFVAQALLIAARESGLTTLALKPVAAGCEQTEAGLRNSDALALQRSMTEQMPYEQVNPVRLEPPIAPHIAAAQAGKRLTVSQLVGYCRGALMRRVDMALVEGAGGWRVPLNPVETLAGLAKELNLPVVMVVGMRLGCLNHALLTAEAIARDGLPLAGWVANQLSDDMPEYQANLDTLKHLIKAPCIGEIPYLPNLTEERAVAEAATYIDLTTLGFSAS